MAVEHGRQWAQRLVGRPGVHVAGSVDDVMHIVEQVVAMRDDLRRLVTTVRGPPRDARDIGKFAVDFIGLRA
jgi:hypothetical protein